MAVLAWLGLITFVCYWLAVNPIKDEFEMEVYIELGLI